MNRRDAIRAPGIDMAWSLLPRAGRMAA